MTERVVLTGASGFIGSHLAPYLQAAGYELHTIVRTQSAAERSAPMGWAPLHICDLTDTKALGDLFAALRPHYLVHLAARAFPSRDLADFSNQVQHTILPTVSLARMLPDSLKLAVFFGSCEEYGNSTPPFFEDRPLKSFSPYGWAKISAYHGTMMIARQKNLPLTWVRPFLTFGPRQKTDQLIPSLIRTCLRGERLALTPGAQTRDFLYVNDLCTMVECLLRNRDKALGETINLCEGVPRTVRSVGETIQSLIGKGHLEFGALPYRADEAMSFFGSNMKYKRLFGSVPTTNFEKALEATIAFEREA